MQLLGEGLTSGVDGLGIAAPECMRGRRGRGSGNAQASKQAGRQQAVRQAVCGVWYSGFVLTAQPLLDFGAGVCIMNQ